MNVVLRAWIRRNLFWFGDVLRGGALLKDYRQISRVLRDEPGTREIRRRMLADVLAYARENVPFYRKHGGAALSDFPVVDKPSILADPDAFILPASRVPGQKGPLHIQSTSGSTGTPFKFPLDTRCRRRRLATLKAVNELVGFHSHLPLMQLRSFALGWQSDATMVWVPDQCILRADNSNLTEEKLAGIVRALDDYDIRFVRGYMTTIGSVADYMMRHGLRPRRRLTFISVGELLQERVRAQVVDGLGCGIVSQYANEESGLLGQSALNGPGGDIELFRANCRFEVLKLDSDEPAGDGELGRVVVTDYINRAMPLIRYDLGDLAVAGRRADDGEVLSLRNLAGRRNDLFYRTDGSVVDMLNNVPYCIYGNLKVRQWQIVQRAAREYVVRVNLQEGATEAAVDCRKAEMQMRAVLGEDADIRFEFVSELPVLSSGKRRLILQEYRPAR